MPGVSVHKGNVMIDSAWLAATLEKTPARIAHWKSQADQLHHLVRTAEITGGVTEDLLTAAESTAGSIHDEIKRVAEVVGSVAAASPEAASQLSSIDDALHLLLLEVTELTTALYAARARMSASPTPMLPPEHA